MKLIILRSLQESRFYTTEITDRAGYLPEEVIRVDCKEEGLDTFRQALTDEIMKQIEPRNEYCAQLGLPDDYEGKAKKASKYIRQHSTPVMIYIENIADLALMNTESGLEDAMLQMIQKLDGYNIYAVGAFHAADYERLMGASKLKPFIKDQFLLLFGGAFHKQMLTMLPSEYKREGLSSVTGRFLMKYRDGYHLMTMPCGGYRGDADDPDEAAIV